MAKKSEAASLRNESQQCMLANLLERSGRRRVLE